jgi:hypothetical protein
MALVVLGALVLSGLLLYQSLYIVRTGRLTLFFDKSEPSGYPRLFVRIAYALLYLFPGVGILLVLVSALRKDNAAVYARTWMTDHAGMIFFACSFVIMGFLWALRPAAMLRWTIRTHPELASSSSAIAVARLIGVGHIAFGFLILAILK